MTKGPIGWIVGNSLGRFWQRDKNGRLTIPRGASYEIRSSIIFGVYELPERRLIKKWLPARVPCIELGASIGIITREIGAKLDKETPLVAVEAVPSLADHVRENLRVSRCPVNCRVVQAAVWYDGEEVAFDRGTANIEGRVADNVKNGLMLPCTTLRRIVQEAAFSEFSLVMDIEGAEFTLIDHDSEILQRCSCIIAELHGPPRERERFENVCEAAGLQVVDRKHSVVALLRESAVCQAEAEIGQG